MGYDEVTGASGAELKGDLCARRHSSHPFGRDADHRFQPRIFSIPEDQNFFSVLLPNGRYYAYAWAPGYELEGAYTDSSGLMKSFVVQGGELTSDINLCDWSPHPHGRVSLP